MTKQNRVTRLHPKDASEADDIILEVVSDDVPEDLDSDTPPASEPAPAPEPEPQKLVRRVKRRDAVQAEAVEVVEPALPAVAPAPPVAEPAPVEPAVAPAVAQFEARVIIVIDKNGATETYDVAHVKSWVAAGMVKTIHRTLAENGYQHTAKIVAIKLGGTTQEDIIAGTVYQPQKRETP